MRMNKGKRVALTVRLPFDEYREVAVRARGRNWSLSDYVGFCVRRELDPKTRKSANVSVNEYATMRETDDA